MNSWIGVLTRSVEHSQVAALLFDTFLKSFVILLVAGGLCLGWRRSSASARHLLWLLAMASLLCLPGLARLLPAWQKPLWALRTQTGAQNELTLTLEFSPGNAETGLLNATPSAARKAIGSSVVARDGGQRLATHFRAGWAAGFLVIWLGGATFILASIALGRWRLLGLRRDARVLVNEDWLSLLAQLGQELGLKRRVTLLRSAEEVMPVTWGWWRAIILLPAEADQWPPERRRVVLLHELAHVKRWDCLTQMLARLACAVYWFNPLVWLAAQRMCVERERACDDLVLNGGCKASDYATHLVEIARSFRRVPQVAAIAMARSSQLEGRIAAIVDVRRRRGAPQAWLVGLGGVAVLAFVGAVAAQKAEPGTAVVAAAMQPWFDTLLRGFFTAKAAQARQLAGVEPVAREVWPYFDAGIRGDWATATNLWVAMRRRAHQYEGTTADSTLDKVWGPILETDLAWEQYANWSEKYVLAYGNDIIRSIPPSSIYFGGTDPGRGVITAMSESHADAKPFFTLTQNALADSTYLDYLQAMYGGRIYTATTNDSQKCFQEYTTQALRRLKEHKLKPGENVTDENGKLQITGQVAVMSINGLLTKIIFDRNPDREFYIEESFPLDWMYPYLSANGLIMKINRQPLTELSAELIQQDHEYWTRYLAPMLGDWLNYDTTVRGLAAFVEQVHINHDRGGFAGDPEFIADTWAQKAFSKLRSSIGGVYAWRVNQAVTPQERQRMTREAEFAFQQAYAICPTSPEALFRYVNMLVTDKRFDDARLLAKTTLKLDPKNKQVEDLVQNLKSLRAKN